MVTCGADSSLRWSGTVGELLRTLAGLRVCLQLMLYNTQNAACDDIQFKAR
jgi:hypothetical protein